MATQSDQHDHILSILLLSILEGVEEGLEGEVGGRTTEVFAAQKQVMGGVGLSFRLEGVDGVKEIKITDVTLDPVETTVLKHPVETSSGVISVNSKEQRLSSRWIPLFTILSCFSSGKPAEELVDDVEELGPSSTILGKANLLVEGDLRLCTFRAGL